MIIKILNHYHIRFQKEHRLSVLFQLVYNLFVEKIWKIRKRIQGIDRPIVHVYAICWNEERFIPFFLQHYNGFVDHYYIYDNYSDDKTNELLAKQSNITVVKYDTEGSINDLIYQRLKNTIWKQSRGRADWVIVIDMDELLYHPQIKQFLIQNSSFTLFKPQGYNMVAESFPGYDKKIIESVNKGVKHEFYSKCVLFNPYRIVEINYEPGAHENYPEGIVSVARDNNLKLLHYKNLGIDYVLNRIKLYEQRMSKTNQENNFASHYKIETQMIIDEINKDLKEATTVIHI